MILPSLPRLPNGKPNLSELRDLATAHATEEGETRLLDSVPLALDCLVSQREVQDGGQVDAVLVPDPPGDHVREVSAVESGEAFAGVLAVLL